MVAWTSWDWSYWPVSKLLPSLPPHPSPLTSYHAHQKDNDFSLIKQSLYCHCLVSNYKASSVGAFMVMQCQYSFWVCFFTFISGLVLPHFCLFWNWGVQNNSSKSSGRTLRFQKDLCHQMVIARLFKQLAQLAESLAHYQLYEDWWFVTRYSKDKSHLVVR